MNNNTKSTGIFSDILAFIIFLSILFCMFVLPFLLRSGGASEPFYDNSEELEARDEEMKRRAEDYEREQRAKEAQEEYEDYLEWVREGRP